MENTHRGQLVLGQLPEEFLRSDNQIQRDQSERASIRAAETIAAREASQAPNIGVPGPGAIASPDGGYQVPYVTVGRLSVTVVEAKLAKNYSMLGLTRMDPYCRIRVGHNVYETETSHNGAKNPMWGKILYATLPNGVDSFTVEIFDEKSFMKDERVAWTTVPIPTSVFDGETTNEWYPLTGKQGTGQEGQVNLILSYNKYQQPMFNQVAGQGAVISPLVQQPPPPPQITDEDINQIHEMFPTTDKQVIKTVLTANNGNKDATINSLLQMQ